MKVKLTLIFGLFPIRLIRIFLLRLLGHDISFKSRIGWGLYLVKHIKLAPYSRVGALNFIRVNKLDLDKKAFIKNLNYIKGPFNLILGEKSGIAMQNKIRRAYHPVTYGVSELRLGYNTFIVSNNFFDLTRSITMGDHTQLGGIRTEFWTHGYMHYPEGGDRIRIDGEIHLGNNVYVGSRCIFNPGVRIHNAINIGGNAVVSKDLVEPGMYVNQSLRHIPKSIDDVMDKLNKLEDETIIERVYLKN